jgi:hypothetical protein
MRTGDICQLAADLASEHGAAAIDFARHARASLELEGDVERARFWQMVAILLDDIFALRLDPALPLVIH